MNTHLLVAAVCCWASLLSAQTSGTVRGTVTDSLTGTPLAGVHVGVGKATRYRGATTDSLGRYVLSNVPFGRQDIEFRCPSRTFLGRRLVKRQVVVDESNHEATLSVHVPPRGCFEPDSSSRMGIYRGYYSVGFEESQFIPCHDSAVGLQDGLLPGDFLVPLSAWVAFAKTAFQQKVAWPPPDTANQRQSARYFVRWRGTLTGPGIYGHMGVSAFRFVVDSILDVRVPTSHDCR